MTIPDLLEQLVENGAMIYTKLGFGPYVLGACAIIAPGKFFFTGINIWSDHDAHSPEYTTAKINNKANRIQFKTSKNDTYYITPIEEILRGTEALKARREFEAWKVKRDLLHAEGKLDFSEELLETWKIFETIKAQNDYDDYN